MAQILPGFSEQDEQLSTQRRVQPEMAALSRFVGRPLDAQTTAELGKLAPGRLRVLNPGDMRTMDVVPDRLNVMLDERGVIRSLTFG